MYLRINNSDGLPIYIDRCLYYYTFNASKSIQYTSNTIATIATKNNNNNQQQ